jgi:hypothetical protein
MLATLALVPGPASAGSKERALDSCRSAVKANDLGDYASSLSLYRSALAEGYASAELFHSLGCAAFRAGEPGWAVYYFEQARRRSPRDPDIAANLALAEREAQGESVRPSRLRFLDDLAGWLDALSLAMAFTVFTILFWIVAATQAALWLGKLRRVPARTLPVMLLLLGFATLLVGTKLAQHSLTPDAMLVRASSVRVEPALTATVEFSLPAGSAVDLARRQADWCEVVVSSSLRGWVPVEDVAAFENPR